MNDAVMLAMGSAAFVVHYLASEHLVVLHRRRPGTEVRNRLEIQLTLAAGVTWALPSCFVIGFGLATVVETVVVALLAIALQYALARRLLVRTRHPAAPAGGPSSRQFALRLTIWSTPVWVIGIVYLGSGSYFVC